MVDSGTFAKPAFYLDYHLHTHPETPMKNGVLTRAVLFIAASMLGALTLTGTAQATSLVELSTEQLVDAADAVVRGTIVEVWTEQDNDGVVWTRAQLNVSHTYKGDASRSTYIIDQVGGRWGEARTIVHSTARFSANETVLLFLETLGSGKVVVVGMKQGKYTVRLDPRSRELLAQRFTPAPTQRYDHRFIPLPKAEHRLFLTDLEGRISSRLTAGWDGSPIPGASIERLQRINRTTVPVEVK